MSRLKDIEHDGFEFFGKDDRIDRKKTKVIEKGLAEEIKNNADRIKAELQIKYLSPENDAIWEGDLND